MAKGWHKDSKRHEIAAHGATTSKNLIKTIKVNPYSAFHAVSTVPSVAEYSQIVKNIAKVDKYINEKDVKYALKDIIKDVGLDPNKVGRIYGYTIKPNDNLKINGLIVKEKGSNNAVFLVYLGSDNKSFEDITDYYDELKTAYKSILTENIYNIYNDPNLMFNYLQEIFHKTPDEVPEEIKDNVESIHEDALEKLGEYLMNEEMDKVMKNLKKNKKVMNEFKKRLIDIAKKEKYNSTYAPKRMNEPLEHFISYYASLIEEGVNSPEGVNLKDELEKLTDFLNDNGIWIDTKIINNGINYDYLYEYYNGLNEDNIYYYIDKIITEEIGDEIGQLKSTLPLELYPQSELKKFLLRHRKSLKLTKEEIEKNQFFVLKPKLYHRKHIALKQNEHRNYVIYKWNGKTLLDMKRLNPLMISFAQDDTFIDKETIEAHGGAYIDNVNFKNKKDLFDFINKDELYIDDIANNIVPYIDGYYITGNFYYTDNRYEMPIVKTEIDVPMHSPKHLYQYEADYPDFAGRPPREEFYETVNLYFWNIKLKKI